jgi:membrane peptidoglycan carboxypeptidase
VPPRDEVPPRRREPGPRRVRPAGSSREEFDPFSDEQPTVARARVTEGPPRHRGRHSDGGGGILPPRLSINRAKWLRSRAFPLTVAIVLLLVGSGVLGGTAFLDSVKLSSDLSFPATTTVLYSDGSVLARLGEFTRYELNYDDIEEPVLKSVVASEDQTFWTNEGVDIGSVMRAAWNNFTGGNIQGGSTITQQYARLAFDLDGVTYARKAREAALAWKMSHALSKEQILEAYLNAVPFGRQTYGIEAAARAFFGKTANKAAPPEQQLTWAETMVLVAMVKQPYPDPSDPQGRPGYDPTVSPEADANARQRFDYVREQLVTTGAMSQEDADKLVFPDTVKPYTVEGNGLESPVGIVVNHVLSELTHTEGSPFYGAKDWKFIREGGYQIHTTLNRGAQAAAEKAASRAVAGSPMAGQPGNLQDALVAVQPGTGRVLAYYGGDDGKGADYAGFYFDEAGDATGFGAHPAGSSFKVYTLAAALKSDFSLRSYWQWAPHDMPGRTGASRIQNASTCGDQKADEPCSLLQSTISSLNVPYYAVTVAVTPAKVLAMARDAGVDFMWNDDRERIDLRGVDTKTVVPSQFDTILGIGQYPITVLDHANGWPRWRPPGCEPTPTSS